MNKHFLVTISNYFEHLTGVEFLCTFFKSMSEYRLTVYHVCRMNAGDMSKNFMEMWSDPDEKVKGRLTVAARRVIDKSNELLKNSNMSIDQI